MSVTTSKHSSQQYVDLVDRLAATNHELASMFSLTQLLLEQVCTMPEHLSRVVVTSAPATHDKAK